MRISDWSSDVCSSDLSYFSTVTSQSSDGVLVNIGTFAATDPVAAALGGRPLKPETSTNLSGGIVLTPAEGVTLTVDGYQVDIDDRVALSESLSGAAVAAILRSEEHTSELQSLMRIAYAVFCLKKKKKKTISTL